MPLPEPDQTPERDLVFEVLAALLFLHRGKLCSPGAARGQDLAPAELRLAKSRSRSEKESLALSGQQATRNERLTQEGRSPGCTAQAQ